MADPGQLIPADQIASELAGLGRSGASGAVEIEGQPGGIVYLRRGRLTFAESPAVPDLGTRLIRSRRLPQEVWDQIARDHRPDGAVGDGAVGDGAVGDGAVGAALVGRALISRAELQRLLQSMTFDALLALTAPFAGECAVTGIWLTPQRSHWAEAVLAMDIAAVRRYLEHMTQQLAWYDVTPGGCPQWAASSDPGVLVNSGQRTIARLIDGRTTVGELAWRGGLSLHETMASVGQLVHAGLCTLPVAEPEPVPEPAAALPGPAAAFSGAAAAPSGRCAVPGRPARAELPRRGSQREARATPAARATPLELGLLQRVRQGLERMA